jgi:hypothetical protein
MRTFFGMILGAALTVGGAYIYDSYQPPLATTDVIATKPLVNWDVVSVKAKIVGQELSEMTSRVRDEWNKRVAG